MEVKALLLAWNDAMQTWDVIQVDPTTKRMLVQEAGRPLLEAIRNGKAFSVSKRFPNEVSGNVVYLWFGSNATTHMSIVECISTGQAWVDIYEGAVVTAGTPVTPQNLNLGSTNVSSATVVTGGTLDLTNATLVHETVVPGGTSVRAIGFATEVGEDVIIPSGKDIMIQMTNQAGTAADMSIRMIWWEE